MNTSEQLKNINSQLAYLDNVKKSLLVIEFFERTQEFLKQTGATQCLIVHTPDVGIHYEYTLYKKNGPKQFFHKSIDILKKNNIDINTEWRDLKDVLSFNMGRHKIPVSLDMTSDEFINTAPYKKYSEAYQQWKINSFKQSLEEHMPEHKHLGSKIKI